MTRSTQVLIVGGGPAGLAVAIEARRRGLEVVVLDARRPPIDKACGEGLMPDGVRLLHLWGVSVPGFPFRGIRYLDGEHVAEADFPGVEGLGIRRTRLHAALVDRAVELGVDIHWGVKVEGFDGTVVQSTKGTWEAAWAVGADGLHSKMRGWAGIAVQERRPPRFGVRRHFRAEPWSDHVEVHWSDGCEAYVTPVAKDEVGIALLWSGEKSDFNELVQRFPVLERQVDSAEVLSADRGAGPLWQRVQRVTQGRLALIGDAAGYLDAITGEGLALAFQQASALADALEAEDLGSYARSHRRWARLPFNMIRTLLFVERHPRVRRRVIRTLAREPKLFARLLAIHCRALPLRGLGLGGALRLGLGLLIPADPTPPAR